MKIFCRYILIISLFVFACKKETETIELNYDYQLLPLEIGRYIEYKGDSIEYNYFFSQVKRSRSFYLKESIKDTSRDNLNRLRYEISVQMRFDTSQPWGIEKIHYIVPTKKSVERVEDNLRYIKLIFPNKINDEWNPNIYITQKIPYISQLDSSLNIINTKSILVAKDIQYTNSFRSFDSTSTIVNLMDSTAINYFKLTERYAKNIGLVYFERWNVIAKDPGANLTLPWIDRARQGFYLKLEAIKYGKN